MRYLKTSSMLGVVAAVVAACDNNDPPVTPPSAPPPIAMSDFTISITNLTNARPLSPVALVAHDSIYSYFRVGEPATAELELLAESGDNTDLIAAATADSNVITTRQGAGVIPPGGTESFDLSIAANQVTGARISLATMLVNTNDAFTGLNGLPIASLSAGEVLGFTAIAYDAGTEDDTEAAATIPGPAGGGEGFNVARDDRADFVTMHSGAVTADDGLASSALTSQHRFLNPVARIEVMRIN